MTDNRPGLIRRFFAGAWGTFNFIRRLVFGVIALILLLALFTVLLSGRPRLDPRTALVVDPKGAIVEQYTVDPGQRALSRLAGKELKEVQLRDLVRAIDTAARDSRIERIVLVPDEITGAGLSTMRELGAALDRFRATGKQVVAVSAGMEQNQYFLAAHADRILLDPEGSVLLTGFASYRNYYKDALDKLGVDVHLIKVGEYKSAAEPFVLDHASDDAKQADAYWMGGIWQDYLAEIGKLRKVDPQTLSDDIAHYDTLVTQHQGDLAKLALDQKLVDQLATRAEARVWLAKQGVPDAEGHSFRQIDYTDYLELSHREALPDTRPAVAVVVAEGEIVPGDQPQGVVGGQSTARLIREAREDKRVKALVLRVDSPGGDVTSSEQIRREVAQTRAAGKPVIVSMGDVAASGGYWISMNADEIWAEPTTITGSIGIFGLFVTIPDTLAKLDIHTDGIATTPLAGALDPRRPLSPQIETILTGVIDKGYRDFVGKVAQARGKTPEQIDAIARGRVWSGTQAQERGLVDKLGGLEGAIAEAARRAGIGASYRVHYVEKPLSAFERFALSLSNSDAMVAIARRAGLGLPLRLIPGADAELRQVLATVDALRGRRYGVFAQCFCELR